MTFSPITVTACSRWPLRHRYQPPGTIVRQTPSLPTPKAYSAARVLASVLQAHTYYRRSANFNEASCLYSVHAKIREIESVKMAQTLEFGFCDFSGSRVNRV